MQWIRGQGSAGTQTDYLTGLRVITSDDNQLLLGGNQVADVAEALTEVCSTAPK